MNIVVDTSVIIAVILNEPERDEILKATTNLRSIAPDSVIWEVGNALSAMFKRHTLTAEEAMAAIQSFEKTTLTYVPVDMMASIQLAAECRIYAYDAYILQCARQHAAPLLTLDRPMLAQAELLGITTIDVTP